MATLFKDRFKCSLVSVEKYSTFELQLIKLELTYTVYCALIYRPPKYNKDFIQDFSDFIYSIVPITDNLLIIGDINIHVCCSSNLLGKQLSDLIDSFNITLFVMLHTGMGILLIWFYPWACQLVKWSKRIIIYLTIDLSFLILICLLP